MTSSSSQDRDPEGPLPEAAATPPEAAPPVRASPVEATPARATPARATPVQAAPLEPADGGPASVQQGVGRTLLYVVNDADYFLSHRGAIAERAIADGWNVHVAVPVSSRTSAIGALGAQVHPLSITRGGLHPKEIVFAVVRVYRLCRDLRPDVAHLIALKAILVGGLATWAARVPHRVLAVAGLGHIHSATGFRNRVLRLGFRGLLPLAVGRAGCLIVQNEADLARTGLPERTTLIPGSGVDLDVFRPRPNPPRPPFKVVMPARMLWSKGVGEFVEAARLLADRRSDIRFVLAGDSDPDNPESVGRDQLQAWHTAGVVEWLGRRTDMPHVLAESHAVCLPSYYGEGVPKCLLEAAAAGRAVVTTDMPGCRAAIEPERTGLAVPPRDAPALAAAIERLADTPDLCDGYGRQGRALAERRFSLESVIAQHLRIYQAGLATAGRTGGSAR